MVSLNEVRTKDHKNCIFLVSSDSRDAQLCVSTQPIGVALVDGYRDWH